MVGNLYHKLLSLCFNNDFDFEYEWNNFLSDKELSNKDKLLLKKLKEELKIIIKQVNELKNDTGFTNTLLEHVIKIDKSKDIPITFTGIIDKLMMSEVNDKTLFSIIDYKTGNPSPSLNNLFYGLDMQLPIYLYLVHKMNLNNPTFTGMYLQKIINNEIIHHCFNCSRCSNSLRQKRCLQLCCHILELTKP
jgi:ATP-dependent helicase/DNAse subunit B